MCWSSATFGLASTSIDPTTLRNGPVIHSSGQSSSLLYKWQDLDLPEDWVLIDCSFVYLGAGRFCITKIFEFGEDEDTGHPTDMGAVISGVEVVPSDKTLQMVKHKSKFYNFVRMKSCVSSKVNLVRKEANKPREWQQFLGNVTVCSFPLGLSVLSFSLLFSSSSSSSESNMVVTYAQFLRYVMSFHLLLVASYW
ncbi:hypothetical protein ZWY2020_025790 [Hordeum vulgare]|nr:hypothetical protein ZWY2020_025790 [Hordeum vulgare]